MGRIREAILGAPSTADTRLRETEQALASEQAQSAHLQESLDTIERNTTEDEGWRRLGAQFQMEFSRGGLKDIVETARALYMYHPLIRRGVNVTVDYTWGQGWQVKAGEEGVQEIIDDMMSSDLNKAELYGQQAQMLTDIDQMNDGSVFFRMPTDIMGDVTVIGIPPEEIERVFYGTGSEAGQARFYERIWEEEELDMKTGESKIVSHRAYYPDHRYYPARRPSSAGSVPILWNEPIIHQRSGGLKRMHFGVPQTFSAFEWARAYKKFLEDWHTLVSSLSRFAWKASTKRSRIKRLKDKLNSQYKEGEGFDPDAPSPGSVAITDANTDISPIPKTGATTSAEDAKPSRLMVASAMNIPDTMLSEDPQQGALATAKTLDRPTELYITGRQTMWKETHTGIFLYAVRAKQRRGLLSKDIDTDIEISFPAILEADLKEQVGAIISAATMDGKALAGTLPEKIVSEMLMQTLGVDNIQEAMEELGKEQKDALAQAQDSLEEALRGAGIVS